MEGTCAVEWEGHQCHGGRCGFCIVIILFNGNVTIVTEPVTFTGDGYVRYTLLDSGIAKQQAAKEVAFYKESFRMRIQTVAEEGLLFQMGGANDFAALKVSIIYKNIL